MYAVLSRLSLIHKPRQPYGTDELRYELRMKPFLSIGLPDVIPFEHFQAQTTMEYHDTASLLEQASVSIAEAKKQLQYLSKVDTKTARATICEEDHKTNMKNMLRSCFGIGVAVGVLAREVEEAGMGPETEGDGEGLQAVLSMEIVREGFHKSFPVPSIKRKKEAEAGGN